MQGGRAILAANFGRSPTLAALDGIAARGPRSRPARRTGQRGGRLTSLRWLRDFREPLHM